MRWLNPVCVRNAAIVVLLVLGGILASCGGEGSRAARVGYQPGGIPTGIPSMNASAAWIWPLQILKASQALPKTTYCNTGSPGPKPTSSPMRRP
jgi:hypothetical protein